MEKFYRSVTDDFKKSAILTPEQENWLTQTRSLEEVLESLRQVQASCAQNSRHRIVRFLKRFSSGLMKRLASFSEVNQTLVSSNSQIAALVWGSSKVIIMVSISSRGPRSYLQIYKDITEAFESLLTMLERLIIWLPRFETYQSLFLDQHDALSRLYQDIITFCLHGTKFYKKPNILKH